MSTKTGSNATIDSSQRNVNFVQPTSCALTLGHMTASVYSKEPERRQPLTRTINSFYTRGSFILFCTCWTMKGAALLDMNQLLFQCSALHFASKSLKRAEFDMDVFGQFGKRVLGACLQFLMCLARSSFFCLLLCGSRSPGISHWQKELDPRSQCWRFRAPKMVTNTLG